MFVAAAVLGGLAEGAVDRDGGDGFPEGEVGGVEGVLVRMPAAEVEVCGGEGATGGDLGGAFLDEAAEGGEAGAGGDEDEGDVFGVRGEVEGGGAGADGDVDDVAGREGREVVRGDADVAALAAVGGFVEDGEGEGGFCGVGERRGGDGVLADTHGD